MLSFKEVGKRLLPLDGVEREMELLRLCRTQGLAPLKPKKITLERVIDKRSYKLEVQVSEVVKMETADGFPLIVQAWPWTLQTIADEIDSLLLTKEIYKLTGFSDETAFMRLLATAPNLDGKTALIYDPIKKDVSAIGSTSRTVTFRVMRREGFLNGKPVDVQRVAADPKLSALVSDAGPLRLRFPSMDAAGPGAAAKVATGAGLVGGLVGGAAVGFMVGGPVGAAVGALLGGAFGRNA